MKKIGIFLFVFVLLLGVGFFVFSQMKSAPSLPTLPVRATTPTTSEQVDEADVPARTILAENLDTPWALAFLPEGEMLITERFGRVTMVDPSAKAAPVVIAEIPNVKEIGEGGLLGIAIHPEFERNKYVYLYYTYSSIGGNTLNRVIRMTFTGTSLIATKTIVDSIPGASNHDGGRITFGPDKLLYIGTGDAQNPTQAQSTTTLGGKILRVTDEGKAALGNPFTNQVYSYGHRNVQGLTWDDQGNLWATEHGRSGVASGLDELNFIKSGGNYGWPAIEGDEIRAGMVSPAYNSGESDTWAPSGAAFLNGSVYFSGLRGQSLYEAVIDNGRVVSFRKHLDGEYGRIREIVAGLDKMLYITTSNKDGRGVPRGGDDKIIRINPAKL